LKAAAWRGRHHVCAHQYGQARRASSEAGIIVPHLHRESDVEQRRVWIGMVPPMSDDTGKTSKLGISGVF
jgi:hypothetical protein